MRSLKRPIRFLILAMVLLTVVWLVYGIQLIYRLLPPRGEELILYTSNDERICAIGVDSGRRRCFEAGYRSVVWSEYPSWARHPAWSPDGQQIAFQVQEGRGHTNDIYVVNIDGSNLTRLTSDSAEDYAPAWSPDGQHIAFTSRRDGPGGADIYVIRVDDLRLTRLTEEPGWDVHPAWSPDGRRIAFASDRDGDLDIYLMNADGTGVTKLTHGRGFNSDPAWSPDGQRIAFDSDRGGNQDIYVINVDGSNEARLTYHPQTDFDPTWSPDGQRIAFASYRDSKWGPTIYGYKQYYIGNIYVINSDGSGLSCLPNPSLREDRYAPAWSP